MISAATEGVRRITPTVIPVRDRGDRRNRKKFPDLEAPDEETDETGIDSPDSQESPPATPEPGARRDPEARIDIRVDGAGRPEAEATGRQSLPSAHENILIH
ncbi:MAG: hypothetical protein ACE5IL_07910 [Myxococcota bacterium]